MRESLSTHPSLLFSRDGDGAVKFGTRFKGLRAQIQNTIRLRPNALLLSAAAAGGISSIMPVFDFFAKNFIHCEARAYEQEAPSQYCCGSNGIRTMPTNCQRLYAMPISTSRPLRSTNMQSGNSPHLMVQLTAAVLDQGISPYSGSQM